MNVVPSAGPAHDRCSDQTFRLSVCEAGRALAVRGAIVLALAFHYWMRGLVARRIAPR